MAIPEWNILSRELAVSLSRGPCSFRDLELAAGALGVSVWGKGAGRRVSKAVLRRRVAAARVRPALVSARVRTFAELEEAVSAARSSTRRYVHGKRRRLSRRQLETILADV